VPTEVPRDEVAATDTRLTHLKQLEAEAIHVIREVVAQCERPVMMYSIGKDSSVMLHLARKAFHPAPIPFPLLHIDTTWKFRDMIAFRDKTAADLGVELIVHTNPDGLAQGINPFDHGSKNYTDIMKTQALKQALTAGRFDAAFGGARRDEEKSRAKERVFSFRDRHHRWDPKNQRPELWSLYNGRVGPGESVRVFPLSNWTELDIWQYIHLEQIPIVPLYYSAPRPVVERDGVLIMVDDDRFRFEPGEEPRALGAVPHARLLPAVGRGRVAGDDAARDHPGDAARHPLGAGGPGHRLRPVGLDGGEEARGVLLMAHASELIATDIEAYLAEHERKDLLRLLTCGSVDDGKSTLIGRLLHDSHLIYEDHLAAIAEDSRTVGTTGDAPDLALLTDGLKAEREQGITIDVAYRYFSTARRKFIIADTPGTCSTRATWSPARRPASSR
jgi:sulfate adenylyltransferase subunit 2